MKICFSVLIGPLVFLLLLSPIGLPDTLYVPQDFETIQSAIEAASNGDVVLVAPNSENGGPYIENINFMGKAITVMSSAGPEETTIDGGAKGVVVRFIKKEGPDSILEGFTIRNGAPYTLHF